MAEQHLCQHADIHVEALSRRLLFQAFWPFNQADACRQGRPKVQTAKIILAAQPVQVEVMHWRTCIQDAWSMPWWFNARDAF